MMRTGLSESGVLARGRNMKRVSVCSAAAAAIVLSVTAARTAPAQAAAFHVVGDSVAYFYDGALWNQTSPDPFPVRLFDVWGSSNSNLYAVGYNLTNGVIYHYDGQTWTCEATIPNIRFRGVWGTAEDNVFAVGSWDTSPYGRIYHYDGSSWSLAFNASFGLNAIWGDTTDNVYAAGSQGGVLRFNGSIWTQIRSNQCTSPPGGGCSEWFASVWGASGDDIYFAGDVWYYIIHPEYSNTDPLLARCVGHHAWLPSTYLSEWVGCENISCGAIWGTSETDIFVGARGSCGPVMYHFDGDEWTVMNDGAGSYIWGASGTDVYSVYDKTVYHYDGAAWTRLWSGSPHFLYAIWGEALLPTNAITPPRPSLELRQNYPNPFNPTTTIKYSLSYGEHVTLAIYDAAGRHVITLVNADQSAGVHSITWTGSDEDGISVTSGVYFCRLTAGSSRETAKMVLLR
jgi:hypothetical protein